MHPYYALRTFQRLGRRGAEGCVQVRLRCLPGASIFVQLRTPEGTSDVDISAAATGADRGTAAKSDHKKIIIHNPMGGALRTPLAQLSRRAPDPAARRRAVESLLDSLTDETVQLLRNALAEERDGAVQETLRTALALADLDSSERTRRRAAIETLGGSMHAEVRNRLVVLLESHSIEQAPARSG
jgi:hypothetical protein